MKLKTKKIVAKRFKITKRGKIMRGKQNGRHLRRKKSKSQLRGFGVHGRVSPGFERSIRAFLPYG